jgi:NADH-quinone oxidoreductase subunit L
MARIFGFFSLSPAAMSVFLAIGTISMLMASTMAMVSRDIKQVWAYSTISQLGFMIMGLAAGGYSAGVFHLTTHAGFKALLFLCSGVFIHSIGTNDMVAIGRAGGGRMKIPMICMAIAAASLSGIPPFSGFFSKERILGVLARQANPVWIAAGLLGAFLTAYYTFRLIFTILVPDPEQPRQEGHPHAGTSGTGDPWMMPPLVILACLALVLGWIEPAFVSFLDPERSAQAHSAGFSWIAYAGMGSCFAGVLLAWIEFGRKRSPRIGFVERLPGLAAFFSNRWYLDRLYQSLLAKLVDNGIARLFAFNDTRIIDGALDGLGTGADRGSERLGVLQTLSIQTRLAVVYSVLVLLALASFV